MTYTVRNVNPWANDDAGKRFMQRNHHADEQFGAWFDADMRAAERSFQHGPFGPIVEVVDDTETRLVAYLSGERLADD